MNQPIVPDYIRESITELNNISEPEFHLDIQPETILLRSKGGRLDSLGLVNLVVITEQKIAEKLNKTVSLTDLQTFTMLNEEITDLRAYIDYIESKIKE